MNPVHYFPLFYVNLILDKMYDFRYIKILIIDSVEYHCGTSVCAVRKNRNES